MTTDPVQNAGGTREATPGALRRGARILVATFLSLVVCLLAAVLWVFHGSNQLPGEADQTFFVSRGQSFASIVDSLESRGIIRNRALFVFTAKMYGGAERVRVGKYAVGNGISNAALFQMLRSGKGNLLIPVTIPEGSRIRAQAKLFARMTGIDSSKYARLALDPLFARSLGIDQTSLEGYLLPDTYELYWEQDEREILKHQVENFQHFFNDSLKSRAAAFNWDAHRTLTFASIVEGEAVLNDERPIIAGVYHNRLQKRMKLEADPTVQYMITDGPRRILYSDLRTANPYNTYRYPGLPPGPVNNPGRASILASLYPAQHGYLFFVANGHGGHWFARTYEDHLRYVRMYKRQRARQIVKG